VQLYLIQAVSGIGEAVALLSEERVFLISCPSIWRKKGLHTHWYRLHTLALAFSVDSGLTSDRGTDAERQGGQPGGPGVREAGIDCHRLLTIRYTPPERNPNVTRAIYLQARTFPIKDDGLTNLSVRSRGVVLRDASAFQLTYM
jgi:hypothetical protein